MIIALDGFKKKEVKLVRESRYLNTVILGQKGTGKSDHVLLNMFYQDLDNAEHSLIVFTSKGDTSYKLYSMAKQVGRKVHLIKPETNTFHINILDGMEKDVIENMEELFKHAHAETESITKVREDMERLLLRNAIKLVKRSLGEEATLEDVYSLITNKDGLGRKQIGNFGRIIVDDEELMIENKELISWFLNCYFNEAKNIYYLCSGLRLKIKELLDYQRLYQFEPKEADLPNFEKIIKNKEILIVDSEVLKYREYANLIGSYLLLKLKRLFLELEEVNCFMYIDDFYKYYPVFGEIFEASNEKEIGLTIFLQETGQCNKFPYYKDIINNSVSNIILLERLSHADYILFREQMNGELLNRKRGEIVYKIINAEGSAESTSGTLYAQETVFFYFEKFLDYKKQLMKKKRKKIKKVERKVEEANNNIDEATNSIVEDTSIESNDNQVIKLPITEKKRFEPIKREGTEREYLSLDEIFDEETE